MVYLPPNLFSISAAVGKPAGVLVGWGAGGGCKQSEVTIFSRILRHPDFGPALMSLVVGGGG